MTRRTLPYAEVLPRQLSRVALWLAALLRQTLGP